MSRCSLVPATERTEDDKDKEVVVDLKDKEVVDDLKRALLSSILQCLLVVVLRAYADDEACQFVSTAHQATRNDSQQVATL